MFKVRDTDDGSSAFRMAQAVVDIRTDHKLLVDWIAATLAPGVDTLFTAELRDDGALEFQTPAGRVTSRLDFIFGDDGNAIGRLVFAEMPIPGWTTLANPVFAIRIDSQGKIRSGDDGTTEWTTGRQAWVRSEATRLGYEIFLAQLAAGTERVGGSIAAPRESANHA